MIRAATRIDARRHAVALSAAALLLALLVGAGVRGRWALAAASGALHAAALVVSLRGPAPWSRRVALVPLAAAIDVAAVAFGWRLLAMGHGATTALAGTAAAGAAAYLLALRALCAPPLRPWASLAVPAACLLAALLSARLVVPVGPMGQLTLIGAWWATFSALILVAARGDGATGRAARASDG